MKEYLSLIKFSHTIFALPFALLGFFMAIQLPNHDWSLRLFVLVVACMVLARSAAMAFNRYLDREIDQINPRTKEREIPSGKISANGALYFTILCCLGFVGCTYLINTLCFFLSPVALLVILGYSYTKRFTFLCHLVLGLGLSLAPIGAYLAVTGSFHFLPVLFSFAVLFWVSGFDIIYALQDDDFDKDNDLMSIPSYFGRGRAMQISIFLHVLCAVCLLIAAYFSMEVYPALGYIHFLGAAIFIGMLIYQHMIVSPTDLSKIGLSFFTTNGIASVVFASLYIVDLYF